MQNYILYIFIILFLLLAIYVAFIWSKKRKKLSIQQIQYFQKKLKLIEGNISSKEKIIDADKLYHKILQEIGYKGDFGQILKQKPLSIGDINKIWELHKIRNKLVHDFDHHDETFLREKSREFIGEIKKLIQKVS